MSPIQLKRILCPTDFSDNSKHAMDYGCALADQFQAELHVLHVLQIAVSQIVADPYAVYGLPADFNERMRASAERAILDFPNPEWASGKRVVRDIRQGSPFVEIVRYAREKKIDLIVMGTHGRSGLQHMLIGSVAEKVVRKADCPVLTVRPPNHPFTMP